MRPAGGRGHLQREVDGLAHHVTLVWLLRIRSTRVVPVLGMPTMKIGSGVASPPEIVSIASRE